MSLGLENDIKLSPFASRWARRQHFHMVTTHWEFHFVDICSTGGVKCYSWDGSSLNFRNNESFEIGLFTTYCEESEKIIQITTPPHFYRSGETVDYAVIGRAIYPLIKRFNCLDNLTYCITNLDAKTQKSLTFIVGQSDVKCHLVTHGSDPCRQHK